MVMNGSAESCDLGTHTESCDLGTQTKHKNKEQEGYLC